jgi:CBS domain containing-hemolysin-like protein
MGFVFIHIYIIHAIYEAVINVCIICGQTIRTVVVSLRYICCITSEHVRGRLHSKCVSTRAKTRFRLSAKRTSPFKLAGTLVQSTTGSRGVRISGSNAGYTMFRGSVKSTGYPLHSPVSSSLSFQCVTVCHHISIGLYYTTWFFRI